jgi:hypothetical protein
VEKNRVLFAHAPEPNFNVWKGGKEQCSFRTRTAAKFSLWGKDGVGKNSVLFAHVPEPNLSFNVRGTGWKRTVFFSHTRRRKFSNFFVSLYRHVNIPTCGKNTTFKYPGRTRVCLVCFSYILISIQQYGWSRSEQSLEQNCNLVFYLERIVFFGWNKSFGLEI